MRHLGISVWQTGVFRRERILGHKRKEKGEGRTRGSRQGGARDVKRQSK